MGLSKSVILVSNVNEEELVKIAKEIEILSKNALSQERKTNLIEVKRHEVGIHIENNCGIIIAEPLLEKEYTEILESLSKNRKILFWTSISSMDGVWFEYFKNTEILRKYVAMEGETVMNIGEPLLEENGLFEEGDFSELIELGEKLMGVSDELMFEGEFNVFR